MEVLNIEGPRGPLHHIVPSVWRRDADTVCILLDNPSKNLWVILTLDARELANVPGPAPRKEAS